MALKGPQGSILRAQLCTQKLKAFAIHTQYIASAAAIRLLRAGANLRLSKGPMT
jgi:hypothetical protein